MDEYSYTYDAAHNQTSKTETINGTLKGTTNYTYDSLNRLTEITEPKKTTETSGKLTKYTYDAAGNRETEQITTSTAAGTQVTLNTYKYNEQNRLLSTTEETGDGTKKTTTYSYDPNGNMTKKSFEQTRQIDPSNPPTPKFGMYIEGQQDGATENAKTIAAGTASYEYDVWNQLIKASTGEGTSTYKYNGEGYRTEKTENGVLTRSLYEADKVILETDKNGKETARNIYGTNLISRTVTTTENGTTQKDQYNYMYNGHADVTALLTADGTIVASYYYDAFGTAIEKNENKGINNPYRYAGYVFDNATNLYYLNARYYDSKIARFMSEDTYTGEDSDPLSLNLYTYCVNNPIIYTDPTGHWLAGDENLIDEAKAKIIALGNAWNKATTKEQKEAISKQAEAIRNDSDSWENYYKTGNKTDTLVVIENVIDFDDAMKDALKDGVITKEEDRNAQSLINSKVTSSNNNGTTLNCTTSIGSGTSQADVTVSASKSTNTINQEPAKITIETHFTAYVIYMPDREGYADDDVKRLASYYGVDEKDVGTVLVKDDNDFRNAWNSMSTGKISCVTINMHGNSTSLAFVADPKTDGDRLSNSEILKLNNKKIDNLLLYACNAGHLDNPISNPAAILSSKISGGKVLASDGTVYLGGWNANTYEAKNDLEFQNQPKYSNRDNMGWVMYQKGKTKILDSENKTLTLSDMLSYLYGFK